MEMAYINVYTNCNIFEVKWTLNNKLFSFDQKLCL